MHDTSLELLRYKNHTRRINTAIYVRNPGPPHIASLGEIHVGVSGNGRWRSFDGCRQTPSESVPNLQIFAELWSKSTNSTARTGIVRRYSRTETARKAVVRSLSTGAARNGVFWSQSSTGTVRTRNRYIVEKNCHTLTALSVGKSWKAGTGAATSLPFPVVQFNSFFSLQ